MPEYTTTQAAEMLHTNRRNVQNYAKRHALPKFGREYIIKAVDIEGMREELGKPGAKKKMASAEGIELAGTAHIWARLIVAKKKVVSAEGIEPPSDV